MSEKKTFNKILQDQIVQAAMVKATEDKHYRNARETEITSRMRDNKFGEVCEIDDVSKILVEEKNLRFDNVTKMVFLILLLKFTSKVGKNSTDSQILEASRIILSVDEYMKIRGLKSRTDAYEKLNMASAILFNTVVETEVTIKTKKGKCSEKKRKVSFHLIATKSEVVNAEISLTLNQDLAIHLARNGYILDLPNDIFKINSRRYPYALNVGYKLCALMNMNKCKANEGRVRIITVLKCMKDIPTYQEVMNSSDRHLKRRIYEHVLNTMEALVKFGIVSNYKYTHNKVIMSLDDIKKLKYNEFTELIINYDIKDFPSRKGHNSDEQ